MGAWGTGVFQDDDFVDWIYELEQAEDAAFLMETLEVVTKRGDEYLEAPECSRALAAAETVAALKNVANPVLPDEVKKWVNVPSHQDGSDLVPLALKAIERIRTNSELQVLWDDSDHAAEWYNVLRDLEARLRSTF